MKWVLPKTVTIAILWRLLQKPKEGLQISIVDLISCKSKGN